MRTDSTDVTAHIDRDGAYTFGWRSWFNPYREEKLLAHVFPDLGESAAADMLGELPIGERSRNFGHTAGPALAQLFDEA